MHNAMRRRAVAALRTALRRHGRAIGFGVSASLVAAVGTTIGQPPSPRLLWNASASAPLGLWHVAPDAPLRRGDMVVARLAAPWRALAARRHYLPANVPLLKRVAALAGDQICADRGRIIVNGAIVAMSRSTDAAARPMPRWHGCAVLGDDALLLLTDDPASFDGRYFGPTARGDIIGKATPLWLR
jgi:conjugative transfer signal peptidase TraF